MLRVATSEIISLNVDLKPSDNLSLQQQALQKRVNISIKVL